jgi:hypothetical protein
MHKLQITRPALQSNEDQTGPEQPDPDFESAEQEWPQQMG